MVKANKPVDLYFVEETDATSWWGPAVSADHLTTTKVLLGIV